MLLVTLFWGGNFTATKLAFAELEPLAFTALRFLLATAILWLILRRREPATPLPPGARTKLIWLGLIGNTLYQLCFIEGLARTSATKTALILAGMPAIVVLATWLLRIEVTTLRQRLAVAIATVGVVIVILTRGATIDTSIRAGDLLLLGAVVTWAAYTLLLRHWRLPISSLRITAWTMYTGTPGLVILGWPELMRTDWSAVTWVGWGGLLYAGLLSLVAAYILWNRGVAELGAARTVAYNTLVPLVATAIAMVGLGERPGITHLIGGVLIIGGVLATRQKVVPAAEG